MTFDFLILLAGLVCAATGGELFVRGAVGIAEASRIPPGIIGATVAAFGTSSPEVSVAINSALEGRPQLALGDALGSNVANIGLVLGLMLMVGSVKVAGGTIRRDIVAALIVPLVTAALASDGRLSRADALLLFAVFSVWLIVTVLAARRERSAAAEVLGEHTFRRAIPVGLVGLVLLIVAGRLIVTGAKGIGAELGLSAFVVGVVFVAVGTSVPELATALISRLRGHEELGLGTVLGSNIFNGALIIPIAALITPIRVDWGEISISLAFGIVLVLAVLPIPTPILGRGRGVLLLSLYASSILVLLYTNA